MTLPPGVRGRFGVRVGVYTSFESSTRLSAPAASVPREAPWSVTNSASERAGSLSPVRADRRSRLLHIRRLLGGERRPSAWA
eukprot:5958010-Pleurochrysis_carterae.AAC.1